jgi:hypothetical protein
VLDAVHSAGKHKLVMLACSPTHSIGQQKYIAVQLYVQLPAALHAANVSSALQQMIMCAATADMARQ